MNQSFVQLWRCNKCGANYTKEEWNARRRTCIYCSGNKYNARKVSEDDYTFDSKVEHRRYCELRWLLQNKKIADLVVHPKFKIDAYNVWISDYTADFQYTDLQTNSVVVEDVKSEITRKKRDYQIIVRLMWAVHHIRIIEIVY